MEIKEIDTAYLSVSTYKNDDNVSAEELQKQLNYSVGNGKTNVTTKFNNILNVLFTDTNHSYNIENGKVSKYEKPELTGVFTTVCENGVLLFSYNENAINAYLSSNNTNIASGYEIIDIKDEEYDYINNRPVWSSDYSIEHVIFLNKVVPKSTSSWFSELYRLNSIDNIQNLDTTNVTDMSYMFYACTDLASVDLSHFDTSSVTNMSYLFGSINDEYPMSFTTLNLSSIDTSAVTNMEGMFNSCSHLTSLDLAKFDTKNVTNMSHMFTDCRSLTNLDLKSFNTNRVQDMNSMFEECLCLCNLNISSFRTSSVTNMAGMFSLCKKLSSLDLSNFDTSSVTNMSAMFFRNDIIKTIDLSSFDTSSVTNMTGMFSYDNYLETIYASNSFVTGKVNNSEYMFSDCYKLEGGYGWSLVYADKQDDKTYAKIDTPSSRGYFTEKTN